MLENFLQRSFYSLIRRCFKNFNHITYGLAKKEHFRRLKNSNGDQIASAAAMRLTTTPGVPMLCSNIGREFSFFYLLISLFFFFSFIVYSDKRIDTFLYERRPKIFCYCIVFVYFIMVIKKIFYRTT